MKVYLAQKNGAVVHHTDLAAMERIDGISKPELTVTGEEFEAAGGLVRIIGKKIVLGKTDAEKEAEKEAASLTAEAAALQEELDGKDYKVIKIAEEGKALAEVDHTLKDRRDWCRNRINEIRAELAKLGETA
jgi:hypothetical protein